MGRLRSCRCTPHEARHATTVDGKGEQIAVTCARCHRFASQRCRVCRRDYRDLQLHLTLSECGPFDKAGMWWTADRPATAGAVPPPGASQLDLAGVR